MKFRKINFDVLGIVASIACAIHCAVLPIVITSLPLFGINIINNVWLEYAMIFFAFVIGLYSLQHGYKKHHHKKLPVYLFSVGILLLVGKQLFHQWMLYFLVPGVVCIVAAHWINFRYCSMNGHSKTC
jgi:hypothetical protein